MKFCGRIPVISQWLYRIDAGRLARRAATGDVSAVRGLAEVFCTADDSGARTAAARALRGITAPDQVRAICTECLLRDDPALTALVLDADMLPADPQQQALFLFCTGRTGELRLHDTGEYIPLLAAGYTGASPALRARACMAAERDNTCNVLGRALTGENITQDSARWSYDEWNIVIPGFAREERWDDLWLLAPLAPAPLAAMAVGFLRGAGWAPVGDDRLVWNELAGNAVELWNCPVPQTVAPPCTIKPAGQAARLCFSPDGSMLATGSCDGKVSVRRTGAAGTVAVINAGDNSVRSLAIPAGNTHIIAGSDDGGVRCFRLEDGTQIWSHEGGRPAMAVLPDPGGLLICTGDDSGCLRIIGLADGRPDHTIPLHPSPVTCIARAPDGPVTACGHADGSVSIVTQGEGAAPITVPGTKNPVRDLAFAQDGASCIIMYERGFPALIDTATGARVRAFSGHSGRIICSTVPAAATWFAAAGDDHTIHIWEPGAAAPVATIPLYSRTATCCSASPDGSVLVAGFHDGRVRVYGMPGARLLREFKAHRKAVASCSVSPEGGRLATVSWDGTTKLLRLPDCGVIRTWDTHGGGIAALAGAAGMLLATVTGDGTARFTDGADGTVVSAIDLYTPSVRAGALSPDGSILAVAGADSTLRFWDTKGGSLAGACDRLSTSLRCCSFLPCGSALFTGGWDGNCRIFSVPDGAVLRTLAGHSSVVTCCAVSGDGSLFVTGSNDTTVRTWEADTGEALAIICDSHSEIGAVAFSPDGVKLAAGGADGVVRLYMTPYGRPCGEIAGPFGAVTSLAYTEDSCTLAAGYDSGTVAFFSAHERRLLRSVPAHVGAVTGLAVLENGTLATTGEDGTCRFHILPYLPFLACATPADAEVAGRESCSVQNNTDRAQWAFLRALLAARFRGEVGVCTLPDATGLYDIMVVG